MFSMWRNKTKLCWSRERNFEENWEKQIIAIKNLEVCKMIMINCWTSSIKVNIYESSRNLSSANWKRNLMHWSENDCIFQILKLKIDKIRTQKVGCFDMKTKWRSKVGEFWHRDWLDILMERQSDWHTDRCEQHGNRLNTYVFLKFS